MKELNYRNHRKFDPKYHFVLVPISLIILVGTVIIAVNAMSAGEFWVPVLSLLASIALVLIVTMVRVYPLKMQDRIIRTEQQFRHYRLTGEPLDESLTLKQIAGLRFAGDAEFLELCNRAVKEKLSGEQIKQLIKEWNADQDRI